MYVEELQGSLRPRRIEKKKSKANISTNRNDRGFQPHRDVCILNQAFDYIGYTGRGCRKLSRREGNKAKRKFLLAFTTATPGPSNVT